MSVCVEDITASIFSCALVFWPKYLIYSHSLWHTENVSVWTGHFAWTLTPRITSFRALFADSEVALWKISAAYLYGLAQKHVAASDWKSGCCYCTSPWPVPWGERRDKQLNKCCVSSVSLLALQWKKLGLGDTDQNDYLCVFKLNGDNTKYISFSPWAGWPLSCKSKPHLSWERRQLAVLYRRSRLCSATSHYIKLYFL